MYFENFKCFNFLTINHLSFQSYSKYHMCLLTWSHWNNRRQLTSKTSFWWRLRYRKLQTLSALVTHFESNFHFYALWKRQITRSFTGYGSRAFHRLQKWNIGLCCFYCQLWACCKSGEFIQPTIITNMNIKNDLKT